VSISLERLASDVAAHNPAQARCNLGNVKLPLPPRQTAIGEMKIGELRKGYKLLMNEAEVAASRIG
jgi:hypothetical protein